jgi:hypothetical protein
LLEVPLPAEAARSFLKQAVVGEYGLCSVLARTPKIKVTFQVTLDSLPPRDFARRWNGQEDFIRLGLDRQGAVTLMASVFGEREAKLR